MISLRRLADNTNPNSLAAKLRRKRFELFVRLLENDRQLHILDLGGTERFWEVMGMADSAHRITLLNLHATATRHKNIESILGDARYLAEFDDKSVDIVFSNSVIEHVGEYADQQAMAKEIARVGTKYFVQTPSHSFPIEPHFLFPGFHWLPRSLRVWLVQHFSFGWYGEKTPDPMKAWEIVDSIRLLRKSEMRALFPGAFIYHERFLGLTKSFIAIKC